MTGKLRRLLERSNPVLFTVVAGLAGFSAYFSMYAFRKPFSAATFALVPGWKFALDYKIALVIAQVIGYALSKLIGIKVISELDPAKRATAIVVLILLSWVALVLFALIPAPWNVAAMFLNGLPLGMIWGLVFGYMEGRRTSEVLGAVVCASFIVSSGAVKTVGKLVMTNWHVSPFWMPAVAGALFLPLLFVSVMVLSALPPPNALDEAARVRRAPMGAAARASFLAEYGIGIGLLILAYVLTTALRDFRDNFAAELWSGLGYGNGAAIFTASEVPVAILALAALGLIIMVRDNTRALMVIHGVVVAGFLLLAGSTLAFRVRMARPHLLDDPERCRPLHGIHPVQRHAVRPADGRERQNRHGGFPHLPRGCLGLSWQLHAPDLAQFRPHAAQLAAGVHGERLRYQHTRHLIRELIGGVFPAQGGRSQSNAAAARSRRALRQPSAS